MAAAARKSRVISPGYAETQFHSWRWFSSNLPRTWAGKAKWRRITINTYLKRIKDNAKTVVKACTGLSVREIFHHAVPAHLGVDLKFVGIADGDINRSRSCPSRSQRLWCACLPSPTTIPPFIRMDGKIVKEVFPGTRKGSYFVDYITNNLVPMLQKGDTVIMDYFTDIRWVESRKQSKNQEHSLFIFPLILPIGTRLQMLWPKRKAILRKMKPRSQDTWYDAIHVAFSKVTKQDISGGFQKAGYSTAWFLLGMFQLLSNLNVKYTRKEW